MWRRAASAPGSSTGPFRRCGSFSGFTLKRCAIVEHTHFIHEPRKLPLVLSPEEVARLLDAAPGLKYKAGAGEGQRIDALLQRVDQVGADLLVIGSGSAAGEASQNRSGLSLELGSAPPCDLLFVGNE
jgi:nucleotide-binding universal stress UspA family protein